MTPGFSVTDPSTWPALMALDEVAAVYHLKPSTLQHRLKPSEGTAFTPAPYRRRPALWRKADVLRDVQGSRGVTSFARAS